MTANVLVISKPFFLSGISWSVPSREGFPRHMNKCIDMSDEAIEMLVLPTERKQQSRNKCGRQETNDGGDNDDSGNEGNAMVICSQTAPTFSKTKSNK